MAAMSASSLVLSAGNVVSWSASVIVSVIFVTIIATVVRKHRPDVAPLLLWAALLELLITFIGRGVPMLLVRVVSPSVDMNVFYAAEALLTTLTALLHAGARGLLLWGIVRLARPVEAPV